MGYGILPSALSAEAKTALAQVETELLREWADPVKEIWEKGEGGGGDHAGGGEGGHKAVFGSWYGKVELGG